MKIKNWLILLLMGILLSTAALAVEVRTYRQVKDVVVKENASVSQSGNKGDLFEYTFAIDRDNNLITRTSVRRLDWPNAKPDATVYTIVASREILGSEAGNGGRVLIAVQKNGSETLEIGRRFAFITRTSDFSQVITGVYQRVFEWNEEHEQGKWHHR